ncbi:MAG: 4Fe-4S binding protein [Desulfomonilaceae bacterium]
MYFPKIDRNKCTKCLFCVKICPKDVFEISDNEVQIANPTSCNGCEACVVECPEDAISLLDT